MQNNWNAITEENLDLFVSQVLNQAIRSELAEGAQSTDMELEADVSEGVLVDGYSSFEEISTGKALGSFQDGLGDASKGVIHEAVACTDVSAPTEHLYRDRTMLGSSGEEESWKDEDDDEEIMEITDILLQKLLPMPVDIDKTENIQLKTRELPQPRGHNGTTFKPSSSSRLLNTLLGKTFSLHTRKPTSPSEPDVRKKSQKKDKKGFKFWKKKEPKTQTTNEEFRSEAIKQNSRAEEPTNETKSKLFQFLTRSGQSGRIKTNVQPLNVEES